MRMSTLERLTRAQQWFNRTNERPLLGFFFGSQYPLHRFAAGAATLPAGVVEPESITAAAFLEDFDRLYNLYESGGGDLVWSAAPFFGIPWVEASLGCPVIADHQTGSTRTRPPEGIEGGLSFEVPRFTPDNPWVQAMISFIGPAVEHSDGRYPVGVTLLRGISDLLAAIYGADEFVLAAMDEPQRLAQQALDLADYWIGMGRHLLERVPLFHGGTGSFFYSLWCPGKTIWLQEDAAALLSPTLYDTIVNPALCRIVAAFERVVMHLHPSRFIPIEPVLHAGVAVVELHMDMGGPRATELAWAHDRVLASRPLLIWGDMSRDDFRTILSNRSHRGLAINVVVRDASEADEFRRIYEELTGSTDESQIDRPQ